MEAINVVDMTGLDALEEIRSGLAARGIAFVVARVKNEIRDKLIRAGLFRTNWRETFYPSVRSAVQSGLNERARKPEDRPQEASSI